MDYEGSRSGKLCQESFVMNAASLPCCNRKLCEVAVEGFPGGSVHIASEKIVANDFARAADLFEAMPIFGIGDGKVKKLQAMIKR